MVGLSVIGLVVVAVGAMDGMQPLLRAHAGDVFGWVALAFTLNAGLQAAGALLFARTGALYALSVGLIGGNRNVTLIWVAAAPWLHASPQAQLFLAASVFPIFMLPMMTRPLVAWCCRLDQSRQASDELLRRRVPGEFFDKTADPSNLSLAALT